MARRLCNNCRHKFFSIIISQVCNSMRAGIESPFDDVRLEFKWIQLRIKLILWLPQIVPSDLMEYSFWKSKDVTLFFYFLYIGFYSKLYNFKFDAFKFQVLKILSPIKYETVYETLYQPPLWWVIGLRIKFLVRQLKICGKCRETRQLRRQVHKIKFSRTVTGGA